MEAIEIQDYHHYKPYKYSERQMDENDKFEKQAIKDQINRDLCKHNVRLIEIPYYKIRINVNVLDNIKLKPQEYIANFGDWS